MIRDFYQTQKLIKDADQYIKDHPDALEKTTDEIFDLMNDSDSTTYLKWGVMAKVKLNRQFEGIDELIDFLSSIPDRTLLCSYIGFVLQQENNIDSIELLCKANQKGNTNEIVPFVIDIIPFEINCHVDRLEEIAKCIQHITDSNTRDNFISKYAKLVVIKDKEDDVYSALMSTNDELIVSLVLHMRNPLLKKNEEKFKMWEHAFIESKHEYITKIGIEYIEYSNTLIEDVDIHFYFLRDYVTNDELMPLVVPVFLEYLASNVGGNKREVLCHIINGIKDNRETVIKPLLNYYYYIDTPSYGTKEIVDALLEIDLNEYIDSLHSIDNLIKNIYESNPNELFLKLSKTYETSHISWTKSIWTKIPNIKSFLLEKKNEITDNWCLLLEGTTYQFLYAISCIQNIIDIITVFRVISEKKWEENKVLRFLEGCCLFISDESIWIELLFAFAEVTEDEEKYSEFCYENAYQAYPGKTISIANKYLNSCDSGKAELSNSLIKKSEIEIKRLENGRKIKDFRPPFSRLLTYDRIKREDTDEIKKKAKENALLANLFTSRVMKYGNRIAFVQKDYHNLYFQISPYTQNTYQKELPVTELLYPVEMYCRRLEYLERRKDNETDS